MTTPTRARIIDAAAILQQAGYADVAKFLLARDKKQGHKKRPPKVREVDIATQWGTKARGGKGYVDAKLIEKALKDEGNK